MPLAHEDAVRLIVQWLRGEGHGGYASYGYEVYLPSLLSRDLERQGIHPNDRESRLRELMPALYNAAWDLCRRGILRPGVKGWNEQATAEGASGNGYSITGFGHQWLAEARSDDFVPTEPERFSQMLAPFVGRYGPSFQERAQEAVRCYGAHAYLACCVMCGAAAESVLLATAIAKAGEDEVLKRYNTYGGRRRVENLLLGGATETLRSEYLGFTTLLKYWRDQAGHGAAARITDNEAYTALALLLRFAIFADANWERLTATGTAT
jgi:hypothetical protein